MNNISKIGFAIIIFAIAFTFGCSYDGELVYLDDGSNVYHRDDCKFVEDANQVYFFNDLEETVDNHYRPCKTCNPPDNKEYAVDKIQILNLDLEDLNSQIQKNKDIIKEVIDNYSTGMTKLIKNSDKFMDGNAGNIYYFKKDSTFEKYPTFNTIRIEKDIKEIYGEVKKISIYRITEYAAFYEKLDDLGYNNGIYEEIIETEKEINSLEKLYNLDD